MFNTQLEERR